MASSLHDGLLRLLRDRPSLLLELLGETLPERFPPARELRIADTQLDEVPVREHRADLVLTVGGETPLLVLVVEVQRRVRPEKARAWLSYLHGAIQRYRVPSRLVVLATSPKVAVWAAGPFDFDGSSLLLRPVVLSKQDVPLVTVQTATQRPERAMLALLFHRADPRVLSPTEAALTAIAHLDTPRAADYSELAWHTLAVHLRPAWEALMRASNRKLEPPFVQEWKEKGREEGREEGLERGRATTLLAVLEQRGLVVSDTQRRRILDCRDAATLDDWTRRVLVVESVSALLRAGKPRRASVRR